MNNPEPNAKVLFETPCEDGTSDIETLWATHLGGNEYEIDNSPFYAYGVSWKDVVLAPFSEEQQFPKFKSIVRKSGNRTIRVIFELPVEPGNASDTILQNLVSMGCNYEGSNKKYICVNIPPAVNLESVGNYLIKINATWEHADPTYESLYPEQP